MKMFCLKCCKATLLKTLLLTAFILVFTAAIKIYKAYINVSYHLDAETLILKQNKARYVSVKDKSRMSTIASNQNSAFMNDVLVLLKEDSDLVESEPGLTEEDTDFIENILDYDEQQLGNDDLDAKGDELQAMLNEKDMANININADLEDYFDRKKYEIDRSEASNREHITTNLVLFTTWSGKPSKTNIRKSSLATWTRWYPQILPILFTNSKALKEEARASKWEVRNITETSCRTSNVPTLRGMFNVVLSEFRNKSYLFGFSNGDIMYDDGLNNSISALVISELKTLLTRPVLVVVRRIDTNIEKDFVLSDVSVVKKLSEKGKYKADGSTDFFITNNLFPWHEYPELVIGRMGFGKWTVAFARSIGAAVYDMTRTVTAIHLTGPDGMSESRHNSDKSCNQERIHLNHLINYRTFLKCGSVLCSNKRAAYNDSNIIFNDVDPKTLIKNCTLCENV